MKIGDKVRVIGVPECLDRLPDESKEVFKACVGGVFEITDERDDAGYGKEFELLIKQVQVDDEHYELESIWIEAELLEPA